MVSRKNFLKTSVLAAASGGLPLYSMQQDSNNLSAADFAFPSLGIAGWTFKNMDNYAAIDMMQRLDIKKTTLKNFQLPYDSSKQTISNVVTLFNNAGITIYGLGVIYMKSKAEVDQAFEYAKNVNVPVIIAEPIYELLPYVEQKVKEYEIKLAIHNHGAEDELYPGPGVAYEKVKNLDPKMGLCFDIGYGKRDGLDIAEAFSKYHDRIFDMHIKDVTKTGKDGQATILGRGIVNFPKFMQAMADKDYSGHYSLEYEVDKNPLAGLAESKGYIQGVRAAIL